jgi:hypothetical protein
MAWEGIAAVSACIALVLSVLGVVFVWGKIVSRLEALEARVKEDREKNDVQHSEFSKTLLCVSGLEIKMQNLGEKIDEVKTSLQSILTRLTNGSSL